MNLRGDPTGSLQSIWPFYALLEDLFDFGPGYCFENCVENLGWSRFVVGTIVVDFLAPTDGAAHSSVIWHEVLFQQSRALRTGTPFLGEFLRQTRHRPEGTTPEETFAQLSARYIELLFRLNYHAERYGSALYECLLDRLVILVNGKEHKVFDVEQMYKTYEPRWGSVTTTTRGGEKFYEEWKTWVLERRAKIRAGQLVKEDFPLWRLG